MAKNSHGFGSLDEAIAKLENVRADKSNQLKEFVDVELKTVKETLEKLKPVLEEAKNRAGAEAQKAKTEVETKIKDNPWLAVGLVGILAFIIGWLFGWKKSGD